MHNLQSAAMSLSAVEKKIAMVFTRSFERWSKRVLFFLTMSIPARSFSAAFFAPESHVYICKSQEGVVIAGFFLKSNFPGRAKHIANAGYMVRQAARGKGLGRLLCEASLTLAKQHGFQAIQFNVVFSENLPAVALYKRLGFGIIGTIPKAIRNPDGNYQDGYIMYRSLE